MTPSSQFTTTSFFRNANLTQYGGKADIVLMGSTGSENTGLASGAAGLLASYGRERLGTPLTGNEIRQLLTMTAEDVKPLNTGVIGQADKANDGWDPHFGYGRVNLAGAMARIQEGAIPPEVQINSPDWFAPIDVDRVGSAGLPVRARIATPHFSGGVTWELEYACGQDALDSQFQPLASGSGTVDGEIARLSKQLLDQLADTCDGSIANDAGLPAGTPAQTWPANPYPDPDPMRHAFQIRLTAHEQADPDNIGRYRKTLFAYRDDGNLTGFPKALGELADPGALVTASGGEVSPRLYDLDGDNSLDLVLGTTTGELYAFDAAGNPLPSWNGGKPVLTEPYAQWSAHAGRAPGLGLVGLLLEAPRTPAIGDVTGDGEPEVVTTAGERVYAWHRDGTRVQNFPQRVNLSFSHQCKGGASLCFRPEDRLLTRDNHLKRGFVASPALADLNGDGVLDIVAPSLDQRIYAWNGSGEQLPGFPARVDSGSPDDGGEIVASPTIADLDGNGDPEIVVATNELLDAESSSGSNIDPNDLLAILAQNATGNSATYAIHGDGSPVAGWPVKNGALAGDLLPVVMPGEDAAAGDLDPGRTGDEVVIFTGTGFVRLVGGDGQVIRGLASTPPPGRERVRHHPRDQHRGLPVDRSAERRPGAVDHQGRGQPGGRGQPPGGEPEPALQPHRAGLGSLQRQLPPGLPRGHRRLPAALAAGHRQGGRPGAAGACRHRALPAPCLRRGHLRAARLAQVHRRLAVRHAERRRHGRRRQARRGRPRRARGSPSPGAPTWTPAAPTRRPTTSGGRSTTTSTAPRGTGTTPAHPARPAALERAAPRRHRAARVAGARGRLALRPRRPLPRDRERRPDRRARGRHGGRARRRQPGRGLRQRGPCAVCPAGTTHLGVVYRDEKENWGHATDVRVALPCIPRKLGVSGKRIGPAKLRNRLARLRTRYRVKRRGKRATTFCVNGGGRFLVSAGKKGRIDLIATTARRHRTRKVGPGKKLRARRVRGARPIGRGFFVGRRQGPGRVIYGVTKKKRVRFLAVVTKKQTRKPRKLRKRLKRLGLKTGR